MTEAYTSNGSRKISFLYPLDRSALVYATEVEERYLGFIWSGYFDKRWHIVDLATGAESTVGHMPQSYDNAMAL